MFFFIWHRQVSLNPSGRSTNQMMLPNRMLSYQAKLQNCHEFILSNLISDSEFSINSKFYGRVSKKQKAENWSSIDDGQGRKSPQLLCIHMLPKSSIQSISTLGLLDQVLTLIGKYARDKLVSPLVAI